MSKSPTWPGVRVKVAKGRRYYYWSRVEPGTPWVRLPDPRQDADGFMRKLVYLQRVAVRIDERRRTGTFGAMATLYRQSKKFTDLKPSSRETFERYLNRLLVAYADAPLVELTPEDIQVRVMDANASTPSAADMMLTVMRVIYKFAAKRQRGLEDWTAGVDQFNDHTDREPWDAATLQAALTSTDHLFRRAVALALYTGQRPGDVCAITWGQVSANSAGDPTIRVRQQKTGTTLEIPMHEDLRAELDAAPRATDHLFLLSNRRGGPLTAGVFLKWCQAFTRKHGQGYTAHGLRKNATVALFEHGCSAAEVASITGHKSLAMLEHYGKSRSQAGLARVAILDRWGSKTERERENSRAKGKPGAQ